MAEAKIYCIWGDEDYLIDHKIQEIITEQQKRTRGETEVVYVDTEELSPRQWAQELEFTPLFQMYRIVIMKRPPWLASGGQSEENTAEKEAANASKSPKKGGKRVKENQLVREIWEAYLANPPAGQIVILTSVQLAAGNPLVKLLKPSAVVIACETFKPVQLEQWLQEEVARRGCRFENPGVSRSIAYSGQNLYALSQLLDKLELLCPDGIITRQQLAGQLEENHPVRIFGLIDGVLERNAPLALEALNRLFRQGENENYLLAMLNRQFVLYAKIKAWAEEGLHAEEIKKRSGQKEFTVKKMLSHARRYRWDEIENGIRLLLQTEIDLKTTTRDARMLLEMLTVMLIEGKTDFFRPDFA